MCSYTSVFYVFFFKQKTAYELRSSDWSSDVCSSDLTWNPPWAFTNLAPLAHEMGHGYGLPHSDNSDGDDDTYDNPWDVMSDAWSNAMYHVNFGALPKHLNMAQRDRLGWVDAARQLRPEAQRGGKEWVSTC